ncbi:8811_t:CDS:2 [Diversispora eburnea]|uniref:8811_t:CDS:1 n=1 Tax=Diversispora eburnea TaxID=1213867 RepID=A0A9N9AEM1_9GLOM|nr:8811_t:CDS:2 [Diversispora eburnea]
MGNNNSSFDKKSEKIFSQNEECPFVSGTKCGAGTWICELAIEFPNSIFVGVDLKPVYPSEIKQTNAELVKSNILKGLPFKELIRVTKPQGWIEFYDVDVRLIDAGPNSTRLVEGIAQSMSNSGLNASSITFIKGWLQSCSDNITNINELTKLIPIGVWNSAIGKLNMMGYIDYVKLQKPWIADGMNISEDEFSKLVELTNAEFSSSEYKGKLPVMRVFGQKV